MNTKFKFLFNEEEIAVSSYKINGKSMEVFLQWANSRCEDAFEDKILKFSYNEKILDDIPTQTPIETLFKINEIHEIKVFWDESEKPSMQSFSKQLKQSESSLPRTKECEIMKDYMEEHLKKPFFKEFVEIGFEEKFMNEVNRIKSKVMSAIEDFGKELLMTFREKFKEIHSKYDETITLRDDVIANCKKMLGGRGEYENFENIFRETKNKYDVIIDRLPEISDNFHQIVEFKDNLYQSIENFLKYSTLFFKYFDFDNLINFGKATENCNVFSDIFQRKSSLTENKNDELFIELKKHKNQNNIENNLEKIEKELKIYSEEFFTEKYSNKIKEFKEKIVEKIDFSLDICKKNIENTKKTLKDTLSKLEASITCLHNKEISKVIANSQQIMKTPASMLELEKNKLILSSNLLQIKEFESKFKMENEEFNFYGEKIITIAKTFESNREDIKELAFKMIENSSHHFSLDKWLISLENYNNLRDVIFSKRYLKEKRKLQLRDALDNFHYDVKYIELFLQFKERFFSQIEGIEEKCLKVNELFENSIKEMRKICADSKFNFESSEQLRMILNFDNINNNLNISNKFDWNDFSNTPECHYFICSIVISLINSKNIEELNLSKCKMFFDFEITRFFANKIGDFTNLLSINLSNNNCTNQSEVQIGEFFAQLAKNCKNIKIINVSNTFKQDFKYSTKFSRALKGITTLETLNFSKNNMDPSFSNEFWIGLLSSASTLKVLEFEESFIKNNSSYADLCTNLPKFKKLESLNFNDCKLGLFGNSASVEFPKVFVELLNLKQLNLRENRFSKLETPTLVTNIGNLKKLEELYLDGAFTDLESKALELIDSIKKNCPSITSFWLCKCGLSEKSIKHYHDNFNSNIKQGEWNCK